MKPSVSSRSFVISVLHAAESVGEQLCLVCFVAIFFLVECGFHHQSVFSLPDLHLVGEGVAAVTAS